MSVRSRFVFEVAAPELEPELSVPKRTVFSRFVESACGALGRPLFR